MKREDQREALRAAGGDTLLLFLCGDVMTGRGIDQALPHPVDPRLWEPAVQDAREYLSLAEGVNGPISPPVSFEYVWGDALEIWERMAPDLKLINLETSITAAGEPWPDKGVHYRMSPQNALCLNAAGIDVCALANNHVLDWGYAGLEDTQRALGEGGVAWSGAGNSAAEAMSPARVPLLEGRARVVLYSLGLPTSGIPRAWAAGQDQPGVNLLPALTEAAVGEWTERIRADTDPEDLVVVSIHWGANWGYEIAESQRTFAHELIDRAGVDLVHGHSSHHVKGIEVHQDRPILYGSGDFLTDYEGIRGRESYRGDLGLMYFAEMGIADGRLISLTLVPTQVRRFQVRRANRSDTRWLRRVINREGEPLGTWVEPGDQAGFRLDWT